MAKTKLKFVTKAKSDAIRKPIQKKPKSTAVVALRETKKDRVVKTVDVQNIPGDRLCVTFGKYRRSLLYYVLIDKAYFLYFERVSVLRTLITPETDWSEPDVLKMVFKLITKDPNPPSFIYHHILENLNPNTVDFFEQFKNSKVELLTQALNFYEAQHFEWEVAALVKGMRYFLLKKERLFPILLDFLCKHPQLYHLCLDQLVDDSYLETFEKEWRFCFYGDRDSYVQFVLTLPDEIFSPIFLTPFGRNFETMYIISKGLRCEFICEISEDPDEPSLLLLNGIRRRCLCLSLFTIWIMNCDMFENYGQWLPKEMVEDTLALLSDQ